MDQTEDRCEAFHLFTAVSVRKNPGVWKENTQKERENMIVFPKRVHQCPSQASNTRGQHGPPL